MLKNLHIKIFALLLATVFWMFVVSLENTFYKLPGEVPVSVFNQAQDLALASKLPGVVVTVRAQDSALVRKLSVSDFEAYVDLRNVGAGVRTVPVLVTAKNSQVSVLKIEPSEIDIELQPVREKVVALTPIVRGEPAAGFRLESSKLVRQSVVISGAAGLLQRISSASAVVTLDGTEKDTVTKSATVELRDQDNAKIDGITVPPDSASVVLTIVEGVMTKEVGVRARFTGAPSNGVVKNVQVEPAVISVIGTRENLNAVEFLETEPVDLAGATEMLEKQVKVLLPKGLDLASGEPKQVTVRAEIE